MLGSARIHREAPEYPLERRIPPTGHMFVVSRVLFSAHYLYNRFFIASKSLLLVEY